MPLIRRWNPQENSTAAVWRIEEDEDFFLEGVSAGPHIFSRLAEIKAKTRRLEFLAGRFLLRQLMPGFPLRLIRPDAHDKPRLPENALHFSVSHSYPFAAAVASAQSECGIDIQRPHARITDLANKFLTPAERTHFSDAPADLLLAWSIKEAAYKWQGLRGVEFREHLLLTRVERREDGWRASVDLRLHQREEPLDVHGWQEDGYALAIASS